MFRVVKLVAVLTLIGILGACSEQGDQGKIIATAGDLKVSLAEFHSAYNKITPNFRPDITTLEGKRDFANDLVNRAILLNEANRLGGMIDPKMEAQLESNLKNKMLSVLYREEIATKVEVLGRDVADVYERRKTNISGSHVLVDDVATATRIRAEINSGQISFEDAAAKYSLDQATRHRGGSWGEIIWRMTMPSYQHFAFDSLGTGEISQPYESEIGVHLLRLDSKIPAELASLEELRPSLRSDVRNQLEGLRMREYVGALEEKAALTWNDQSLEVLQELIVEETKLDVDTIPPAEQHVPDATEEQRGLELATFSGRGWTIGNYVDFIASQPPVNRPVTRLPFTGLKELIRSGQIQTELLQDQAEALGLDERADVREEDARIREQILIELVHSRFLQAADVPEEDVRAYYDSTRAENPDALMIPERVDMLVLVHTNEQVVRDGLARIRGGEAEADVILELSLDMRTSRNGGRTGLIARGNYAPQMEEVAFSGRAGQGWSDAIVTESGTGAVKVVEQEAPRIATFEEMKDPLTRNMATARGEAAFEEWLKSERDKRNIEIHDEVLELIGQSVS